MPPPRIDRALAVIVVARRRARRRRRRTARDSPADRTGAMGSASEIASRRSASRSISWWSVRRTTSGSTVRIERRARVARSMPRQRLLVEHDVDRHLHVREAAYAGLRAARSPGVAGDEQAAVRPGQHGWSRRSAPPARGRDPPGRSAQVSGPRCHGRNARPLREEAGDVHLESGPSFVAPLCHRRRDDGVGSGSGSPQPCPQTSSSGGTSTAATARCSSAIAACGDAGWRLRDPPLVEERHPRLIPWSVRTTSPSSAIRNRRRTRLRPGGRPRRPPRRPRGSWRSPPAPRA